MDELGFWVVVVSLQGRDSDSEQSEVGLRSPMWDQIV